MNAEYERGNMSREGCLRNTNAAALHACPSSMHAVMNLMSIMNVIFVSLGSKNHEIDAKWDSMISGQAQKVVR